MEIRANISQMVSVEPLDVINKLIEQEFRKLSCDAVFESNGKFYLCREISGGSHSFFEEEEIEDENIFKYISALKLIKNTLEKDIK